MSIPRVLIVTSCTGEKRFKPFNQLKLEDFQDLDLLQTRSKELAKYACAAGEMYTGLQHKQAMDGVKTLRDRLGMDAVDVMILSAGYGLIPEHYKIVPYEVTFNIMKGVLLDEWASVLKVQSAFEKAISSYDLIFLLLGENYLRALQLPVLTRKSQTLIFFASRRSSFYIRELKAKTFIFPLSNAEAKRYRYGLVGLKGFLFKRFANLVVKDIQVLQEVYSEPEKIIQLLDTDPIQLEFPFDIPYVVSNGRKKKATISRRSEVDEIIPVSEIPPARNYSLGMQYFIPEWDDYVDPNYDFLKNLLTPNRVPHKDDVYAHQIFSQPNYDGILVSKVIFDKNKTKQKQILKDGIHKYLRYRGKIMGDCGAFGYIAKDVPPYTNDEIIDYYQSCHFDYGVSIDHLIVGQFAQPGIREKRYQLTIENARIFISKHRGGGYQFTPIGAVQGWSPQTYAEAVKEYINMGYQYIALGGLAREKTEEIIRILKEIYPYLTPQTKIHLFGVGRLNAIPIFRHLGVTSFDSASPLRKAWLDPAANYHSVNRKIYAAIRIPNKDGQKMKKLILKIEHYTYFDLVIVFIITNLIKEKIIQLLEEQAFQAIREFDANQLSLEVALDYILAYNKLFLPPTRVEKYEKMYGLLLEDRAWKECECAICKKLGVEVVIFRGNDRNRRRGFHNTWIFYKRFKELIEATNNPKNEEKILT